MEIKADEGLATLTDGLSSGITGQQNYRPIFLSRFLISCLTFDLGHRNSSSR